jgi:hypothetical protein
LTPGHNNVSIGSCFQEYRNTRAPVKVKVKYSDLDHTLSVDIDVLFGYQNCFHAKNVQLGEGYFKFSALTGETLDELGNIFIYYRRP